MQTFRLIQDRLPVAKVTGSNAEQEILHYAMQYRQDGPVKIERQQRQKGPNSDGKWYWKRHAVFEQWPAKDD